MNPIVWVQRHPIFLQVLFAYMLTFVFGLIYGGFAISSGTTWIYPGSWIRLDQIWIPLGWWDSHLNLAAMFFQMVTAPLFVRLVARMWKQGSGNMRLSYLGSFAGGIINHLVFVLLLALNATIPGVGFISGMLSPLGAALGYNAGSKRQTSRTA